jgi:hypothetical protein
MLQEMNSTKDSGNILKARKEPKNRKQVLVSLPYELYSVERVRLLHEQQ